ncbi:calcium-binding protein [Phenylobacterium sp.]|uniref:calcium-binding protein n=1 Tax=Phenylobacterium sp. TaxID=1871053 RepID=UPI002E2F01B9|nr:calcium-binding protein [Phenylobacterium sp.]HEX2560471.1 calcium-binding protein [Phenylobacterium sp.]
MSVITGTSGADTLSGSENRDSLYGGGGEDVLKGSGGQDLLDGGAGLDWVDYGTATGAVRVDLGVTGLQFVGGGHARDQLVAVENLSGGAYGDILIGSLGANRLEGRGGDDELTGGAGSDTLDGGAGLDVVVLSGSISDYGFSQAAEGLRVQDLRTGAPEGSDLLIGVERIRFSGSGALVSVSAIPSTPPPQTGGTLVGDPGPNTLQGGGGSESLAGMAGDDSLVGGAGNDTLFGGFGWDRADGGLGDDVLQGGDDGDVLYGGAGQDSLYGGNDGDILRPGAGDDLIVGGSGVDQLNYDGASGGVTVDIALAGPQVVGADQGADTLQDVEDVNGGAYADTIFGADDENILRGGAGDDRLSGRGGDDLIVGETGNDTLLGGAGADTLIGAGGNDSILGGDGADLFTPYTQNAGREDFRFTATPDGIRVDDLRPGAPLGTVMLREVEFVFFSGPLETWAIGDVIEDGSQLPGGAGNDDLEGGASNDALSGDGGNDRLSGREGSDTLNGGSEHDTLAGGAGNDSIEGDTGDDLVILTGSQADYWIGEGAFGLEIRDLRPGAPDGVDVISNVEGLGFNGGATLFSLTSGSSTNQPDALRGGFAADTLQGLDGQDYIYGGAGNDSLAGGDGDDALEGGRGDDTITGGAGRDLVRFGWHFGSDVHSGVTVNLAITGPQAIGGDFGMDSFVGVEGVSGTAYQDRIEGDGAQNELYGGQGADTLIGQGGGDTLNGGSDGDTLSGGAGADDLNGELGHDTLSGGDGEDTLTGSIGDDLIDGGDGVDMVILWGFQQDFRFTSTPEGVAVHDLRGGAPQGADLLVGVERVSFTGGGVEDLVTLIATAGPMVGSSAADTLQGSSASEAIDGQYGDDLLLGLGGDDTLSGEAGHDSLSGGAGLDRLLGGGGLDTLNGGTGDDWLDGGASQDRFVFEGAFGHDRVVGFRTGDVVQLDAAAFQDFAFVRSHAMQAGNDVVISLGDRSLTLIDVVLSDVRPGAFVFL